MGAPPPKKNPALLIGLIGGGALLLVLLVGGVLLLRRGSGATETVSDGKGGTVTLPAKSISKAHTHVPPGCDVLMRVDVGQLLALPSVQKHLVPELDAIQQGATDPDAKKVQELLTKAGIDPKKDIKDGVMCAVGIDQGDANEKFVFVLGGELRPEALVPALKEVDGSKVTEISIDGRKAAQGTDKDGSTYIMGQAADAAIVFASDRALYEAAVKDSTTYQSEYNLAVNTEASFVVGKALIDKGATEGGRSNPFTRDLGAVTRVAGILTLANPRGEVRITAKSPADAKKINTTITTLLPAIKRSAGREKSQAGEIEALAAAKTRIDGNDVVVDLPWTTAGVEQAAQKLAELLRQERQKGKISL